MRMPTTDTIPFLLIVALLAWRFAFVFPPALTH